MRNSLIRRVFPQELCDEVLDYLRHDFAALRACAVSGRAFTRRAQKYLFTRVAVHGPIRPVLLPSVSGTAFHLANLFRHSPHLLENIECVVVFDDTRQEGYWESSDLDPGQFDLCDQDWISKDGYLAYLLQTLTAGARNLRSVVLHVRWQVAERVQPSTLRALLDLMRSPRIEHMEIDGGLVYLAPYGLGPNVRHLVMSWDISHQVDFKWQGLDIRPLAAPIILETLEIHTNSRLYHYLSDPILRSLRHPWRSWVDLSQLKKLAFVAAPYDWENCFWDLKTLCAATLEEVVVFRHESAQLGENTYVDTPPRHPLRMKPYARFNPTKQLTSHSPTAVHDRLEIVFPTSWDFSSLHVLGKVSDYIELPKIQNKVEDLTFDVIYTADEPRRHHAFSFGAWDTLVEALLRYEKLSGMKRFCVRVTTLRSARCDGDDSEEVDGIVGDLERASCFRPLRKRGIEVVVVKGDIAASLRTNGFQANSAWKWKP